MGKLKIALVDAIFFSKIFWPKFREFLQRAIFLNSALGAYRWPNAQSRTSHLAEILEILLKILGVSQFWNQSRSEGNNGKIMCPYMTLL